MPNCRILYFRGGILEDTDDVYASDVVEATKRASSRHPNFTAEIWLNGRKAAVVRPSWVHRTSNLIEPRLRE
jgi:hypothetical protein